MSQYDYGGELLISQIVSSKVTEQYMTQQEKAVKQ